MKKSRPSRRPSTAAMTSFNERILEIDLDDLQAESLENRLELTLATLLGTAVAGKDVGCHQFGCVGYMP